MEHGDGDDGCNVEPESNVELLLVSLLEHPKEVVGKDQPNPCNGNVDGPLKLGVLFALRHSERKRYHCRDNDELPTPEVDGTQQVTGQPNLQESLTRVVHTREDHVANEGKDHSVGMKRTQAAEAKVLRDICGPEGQLQRRPGADEHADNAKGHRGKDELPGDLVVVDNSCCLGFTHVFRSAFVVVEV